MRKGFLTDWAGQGCRRLPTQGLSSLSLEVCEQGTRCVPAYQWCQGWSGVAPGSVIQ